MQKANSLKSKTINIKVHPRRNEYNMTIQINAKEWNFIVKFLPRKETPNEFIN